jgi:amino acid permease
VVFSNFIGVDPSVTGLVENDPNTYKTVQAVLTCVLVVFPLSLTPKMSGLRYISILSVGSMVYIVLMLICQFPSYLTNYWNSESLPTPTINYFTFDFSFFNCLGVIYFGYTNMSQLFPIYKELQTPTKPRVTKVIWRASWIVGFFYTMTPIFGYLSTL